MTTRSIRVLVLPQEIAGIAAGLQSGLRAEGMTVDVLLRWTNRFGYQVEGPNGIWRHLFRAAAEPPAAQRGRRWRIVYCAVARLLLTFLAPFRYQAAVYLGDRTLLPGGRDRIVFKRLGLIVITVFCGSDARPPYLSGYHVAPLDAESDPAAVAALTEQLARAVRRAERSSTFIVNHPSTAQLLTGPYLDFSALGIPRVPGKREPQTSRMEALVVHAPSAPAWKGTAEIRRVVEALRDDGLQVDYLELIDLPHEQVLAALKRATVVIDELYSDVVLGALGVEAAEAGCAVATFGNAASVVSYLGRRHGSPTRHYRSPEALREQLERLLRDAAYRAELSDELHAFVTGPWSPASVCARYAGLIRGELPPQEWWLQPETIVYVGGWGAPQHAVDAFVSRYIAEVGEDALHLTPAVRTAALAAIANS